MSNYYLTEIKILLIELEVNYSKELIEQLEAYIKLLGKLSRTP
jgi:hypothetical protein